MANNQGNRRNSNRRGNSRRPDTRGEDRRPNAGRGFPRFIEDGERVENLYFETVRFGNSTVIAARLVDNSLAFPGSFGDYDYKPNVGVLPVGKVIWHERRQRYLVLPYEPGLLVATGEWVKRKVEIAAAPVVTIPLHRTEGARGQFRLTGYYQDKKVLLDMSQESLGIDGAEHELRLTCIRNMPHVWIGFLTQAWQDKQESKKREAKASAAVAKIKRPAPPKQPDDAKRLILRSLTRINDNAAASYADVDIVDTEVSSLSVLNNKAGTIKTAEDSAHEVIEANAQELIKRLEGQVVEGTVFLMRENVHWRIVAIREAAQRLTAVVEEEIADVTDEAELLDGAAATQEAAAAESTEEAQTEADETSVEVEAESAAGAEVVEPLEAGDSAPSAKPKRRRRRGPRRNKGQTTAAQVDANGTGTVEDVKAAQPEERKFGSTLGDLLASKLSGTADGQ